MTHVISIQSHVAYGYVGNRAAVFPLQRLGLEVTAINTVQFSNHTGYGAFTGDVFSPDHLRNVLDGVESLVGLDGVDAVLSGYMGDEGIGRAVLDSVDRVKQANPEALYCCDPVMGDIGRGFFVREGIPEWMRDHAIARADIVTPNQFELAFLAGRQIEIHTESTIGYLDMGEVGRDEKASDPYQILGLERDVSDATIKKTYRKLIRENHPDTLIAKGMPQEFIDVANEKMAAINAAYDLVEKERGL